MEEFLILLVLGLTLGFVSSFLGIGGGSITIPVLYTLYPKLLPQMVIAISLGSIFLITSLNSLQYFLQRLLPNKKISSIMFITCALGAWLGSEILYYLEAAFVRKMFGVILVVITIRVLTKKAPEANLDEDWKPRPKSMGAVGFCGSLLSSLTGLGGGIIFTPAFLGILKVPIKKVAPYANLAMVFATGLGTLPHLLVVNLHGDHFSNPILNQFFIGNLNVAVVAILGITSLISSRLGVRLNKTVGPQTKRLILGIILLILSLKILFI